MQEQTNVFLEKEPIGKLMRKYTIPCIISLLVAALYNIVDQIFIANADYLGSYGNAANTVVYPMTVVALAIAVMIGDGCCAFVSICLGARENKKAGGSIGSAVLLSILSGVVLMILYFVLQDPILTMFGGRVNAETFTQSKEYFTYITMGIPFYVFGQAMNPIIRSDGSPKFAMASTLAGAVANIILDPIFIFVFRWGMMGAAVATVIGQVLTAVLAIWYLFRMKAVKLEKNSFRFHPALMKKYLPLGICSFLSQISLVAAMAAINNMVQKYSALDTIFGQAEYAQIPMAVIGIVMKFFQIVISIVVGMAAGCIPIVGYNVGAGRADRSKSLFSHLLIAEATVGAVALIIVQVFPRQIINIFGATNESAYYTDFAIKSFRIYLCMMIFACVNKAAFIFLQSLGKPWISTMLSMIREMIFGVGFAVSLPIWFGLDGVLYSMPVSDALTFVVSAIVIVMTYKELNHAIRNMDKKNSIMKQTQQHGSKQQPVIVIGRSFGAGGRSVGKLVAEKLGIPYYDKEILNTIAEKTGLSANYLATLDEKPLHPGMGISPMLSDSPFDSMENEALRMQREAVEAIADKGACVIVGRRADRILKQADIPVITVFVTAPLEARAARVAERDGISVQQAEQKIRKVDRERAEYYNSLSDNTWGNAQNYHICVDTEKWGIEGVVEIILNSIISL